MKDLQIITTAAGRYTIYGDLFLYCCEKAYPEYDCRYVMANPPRLASQTKYYSACMRYLQCFRGHKYTYITDIDMMIIPETPSLLDFHLDEIKKTGLCYSNVPRWREPMGSNRLTGLHFVTDEWWEKTLEARKIEEKKLVAGIIGDCKCDDETMLMRIVKDSNIPVTETSELICRHHGIHIGTFRDNKHKGLNTLKYAATKRMDRHKAVYWQNFIEDPVYKRIRDDVHRKGDKLAYWELTQLEKYSAMLAK